VVKNTGNGKEEKVQIDKVTLPKKAALCCNGDAVHGARLDT
jgi:hypothetical protein